MDACHETLFDSHAQTSNLMPKDWTSNRAERLWNADYTIGMRNSVELTPQVQSRARKLRGLFDQLLSARSNCDQPGSGVG